MLFWLVMAPDDFQCDVRDQQTEQEEVEEEAVVEEVELPLDPVHPNLGPVQA